MLPEQEPPVTEKGAIKWMRENLFSSALNILLTVVSLFVIYLALSLVLPWAFGGVWNAGSLTECREVLFSFYKGSHDGACWAVIEDRWLQILFGFYPPDQYWRPILALVLLFVALAPVLFGDKVPGQLMWFSLAYPFLATWLIWGGSFWSPILAALGFVFGFLAFKILGKIAGPIVANLGAIVAALVWWSVLMTPISDGLAKMVGQGRLETTIAQLEQDAIDLPEAAAALEVQAEDKAAELAAAAEEKDAILDEMRRIRIEEFAIEEQIETKETAVQRLQAAAESIDKLIDTLSDWGGVPAAASDATEAEIAEAEAATAQAEGLIGDVASFLSGAISDLEDTGEPELIAQLLTLGPAENDGSMVDDANAMATKADLIDPISALLSTAEGTTLTTDAGALSELRNGIQDQADAVRGNVGSLNGILGKIIAVNAADLEEPQAQLLDKMAQMAALRDDATVLAQDAFRVSSQVSESRGFLTALESLNEREASLPILREATATARDALPRSQRNMIATTQLPDGASAEEIAMLETYLQARNQEVGIVSSVRETYGALGRVGLTPIDSRQIGGFMLALIIGVAGIVLSLPLGILLALGRQSHLFIVNKICVVFIEVIRGVPLIVWLFTGSLLLNYFLPPGTNFDLLLRVIIMVTLFSAAYIAEVIRGGLAALPTGQYEGADSLGLSYWQSMQLIVLPQAMKISIPGIVNTFIGLFKDTVLVVFIGLLDPIGFSNAIRADTDWNGVYWELFVFIGVLFFIFCYAMGRYSLHLEKKLQREHR